MKAEQIKARNNYVQMFYMLGFTPYLIAQAYDLPEHIVERIIRYGK
jgi:hypothetical protein